MTFVGKIFTVLIFLFSIMFMAFAVMVQATHKNWYEVVNLSKADADKKGLPPGLKEQINEQKARGDRLEQQLNDVNALLDAEKAARAQVTAKNESELGALVAENAKLKADLKTEMDTKAKEHANLTTALASENKLTAEVGGLRAEIRDEHDKSVTLTKTNETLAIQVHQKELLLEELKEREKQLVDRTKKMQLVLADNGLEENTPIGKRAPTVDAEILAVNRDKGLAEISLGKDDGLLVGHELDVYRRGNYIGRIRLVRVTADRAVGELVKEYTRQQPQKGDYAVTNLKTSG